LLEPVSSADAARIQQAAANAGLSVAWIDSIESAPSNAGLIGVGPSVSDPLRVARQLRVNGPQALLLFFAAGKAARDSLKAELIRDPFLYPRFEIIELPDSDQQLTARIGKVVSRLQRRAHMRRTTRRGRGRKRLAQSAPAEPLLAHVLSQTRDAVLSTDLKGRPLTWNEPAARLFGLPSAPDAELMQLIQDVASTGEPRETELGELRISAHAAPVRDADGNVVGVSVIARDDSEYERVQSALREANRQKDEFLAIMSHELRTPLTSILGYADMVLRGLSGPLAPMTTRYVSNVRLAGDRLLELVNGLLDYTRLEAGIERLELRRVDMARLVSQVIPACESTADAKQLEVSLAVHGGADTTVEADEERITHVFRSMLGNALKFTPAGGSIRVNVQPDQHAVRVSITDSGIGMQPDQIGRVWERFYQADASLTRPYGGMGLGLSIARHLVSLHGGRVGAESGGPDRGSTFWFSIPKRRGNT
jgi:signal transduction histidine kinase